MREFVRYYLLKVLLGLVALQLVFFFWLEKRNHRPVGVNDEISVYEGHSVNIHPLRNDSDKDEDEFFIQEVASPFYGKMTNDKEIITYTAKKGYVGIDSFAYQISDGKKISKTAFIKITVNENLRPVANKDLIQIYPGSKILLAVMGNDEDKEGDTIKITEFTSPLHGKLIQEGNELYYSTLTNKAVIDSFHYKISDGFSESDKASVIITVKDKNNPLYPWLSGDIGHPSVQGNLALKNNAYAIKGSGNDIWNNVDNFHYAYQTLEGDFEMITKIISIENTNQWAKGGIMVREALTGPSKNVYICLSKQNGINCQIRFDNNTQSTSENQRDSTIFAPYWVRLVRKGNSFTGYRSPNGSEWTEVRKDSINLPETIYVGLAVTSHDDKVLCEVLFDKAKTVIKK